MARTLARTLLTLIATLGLAACGGETTNNNNNSNNNSTGGLKIDSFTASAASVARGGSVTLAWKVSGAASVSVSISRTPGTPVVDGANSLEGTADSGAIDEATTFQLSVTGDGKTLQSAPITVTVDAAAVTIDSFTATPNPAPTNSEVTLSWATAGADKVTVLEGTTELFSSTTEVASGTFNVTVTQAAQTYTLRAENAVASTTRMVTVTTEREGAINTFIVSPSAFTGASADVTLTFAAVGARFSLTGNGQAVDGYTGQAAGNLTVTVIETTVFEFTAEGAGHTERRQATVAQAVMEVEPNDDRATATAITGGGALGSIATISDTDFFSFTVPAGGNVFADITNGAGGCDFDSGLALWDATGSEPLVESISGGVSDCARIDPKHDSGAANLPAGTYFISVGTLTDPGDYSLVVLVGSPGCGNEILETGEQCDDGNTTSGDSCSATCEAESQGAVSGIGQTQTFSGSIVPANRVDYYQVTLPAVGFIRATTGVPVVGQCAGEADTVVRLFDAGFEELAVADDTSDSACGELNPLFYQVTALEAGTYWVSVESFAGDQSIAAYQVEFETYPAGCGNGWPEAGEQCDDGNTTDGDGCSAQCTVESTGGISGTGGTVTVTVPPPGAMPVYVDITVLGGQSIAVTTSDGQGGCAAPTLMLLVNQANTIQYGLVAGNGSCPFIDPAVHPWATNLPAGGLRLGLIAEPNTSGGQVQVDVVITSAVCGNGLLEDNAGEQCDDGGTVPGDGCDATCHFDGSISVEMEPNDSTSQAVPLGVTVGGAAVTFNGDIRPVADHDYYAFTIPSGQTASLVAFTYPTLGDPASCDFNKDTYLELRDGTGALVAENDDDSSRNGFCSRLDATEDMAAANLTAGTYYVVVRDADDTAAFNDYFLSVELVP
ncbi:MAG: pre-peptidase C-terminal domain-containing protein [Myxococcales bacterium]|nr:pre-peptidase C-terminal domain-containing protein [Myxococcales bacterium]